MGDRAQPTRNGSPPTWRTLGAPTSRRCSCAGASDVAILGFFNLSQIARGLLQSAYLGYAVGKPFAGQGYMRERHRARPAPRLHDLRLHRVEANIQPDNQASIALARGAGFQREGFSPAT